MMGPGFPYMDPGSVGWMMLGSLVFWAGLILLAVFAIARLTLGARRERSEAITILDQRLARGDIDAEEYRARKALLTG
ncbi:MAG: SHOCT domain-containing protein [Chloroflexi bacterium]|nr:SHOCT domain-containing protein [Chloroflexota bacterium]